MKNISPGNEGLDNYIRSAIPAGDKVVFATDASLWITDENLTSASLVKDFSEDSPTGILIDELTAVGDLVFFVHPSREFGRELWVTDGTLAGTRMVLDIVDGPDGAWPYQLTPFGDRLLFSTISLDRNDLWLSDGTSEGTSRLTDLPAEYNVHILSAIDGLSYFSVSGPDMSGVPLWSTDGTLAGTSEVTVIPLVDAISGFVRVGEVVLFEAYRSGDVDDFSLWRTDGTAANTNKVADNATSGFIDIGYSSGRFDQYLSLGDHAFFFAERADSGWEPWRSDGTLAGTVIIKDTTPGILTTAPIDVVRAGDRVFYTTYSPNALWVTDSDLNDVQQLVELSVDSLVAVGDEVYLAARTATDTRTLLYRSDGTAAGTVPVLPQPLEDRQTLLGAVSDNLFFRSTNAAGDPSFAVFDTAAGSLIEVPILPGIPASSSPQELTTSGGQLFFSAAGELHKTDGTILGTQLVKRYRYGVNTGVNDLTDVGGDLFFEARWVDASESGAGVVATDGTAAGTEELMGDRGNPLVDRNFLSVGDTLYFTHMDQTVTGWGVGHELVAMNLPDKTVRWIKNIATGYAFGPPELSSRPDYLIDNNGQLLFAATELTQRTERDRVIVEGPGRELWRSDGSEAGTTRLIDINPAGDSNPQDLTTIEGITYFSADNGVHGRELWRSDGTAVGTWLLKDINEEGNSNPAKFAAYDGRVVFTADDGLHGEELWVSDGTRAGTMMIKDINPGSGRSRPTFFTKWGALVYFSAFDEVSGRELWVTDGTEAGTQLVVDIRAGGDSAVPDALTVFDGALYFAAFDGVTGVELWRSDGTEAGTELVHDLRTGPAGSAPSDLAVYQNALYFAANDGIVGRELWRLRPDETLGIELSLRATPNEYKGAGETLIVDVSITHQLDRELTNVELTDGTGTTVCRVDSLWPGIEAQCTLVYFTLPMDVEAGSIVVKFDVTSDQSVGQHAELVVERTTDVRTFPRILVTPDRVDSGNYGWVLYDDGSKQWIDDSCRADLEAKGLSLHVLPWITISRFSDGEPKMCDDIAPDRVVPVGLLTTPDRLTAPDYGWVTFNDGSKQWIDASCRDRLAAEVFGLEVVAQPWSYIETLSDRPGYLSCDELIR